MDALDAFLTIAAAFVTGELLPTLAALAVVAASDPLTWALLVAGVAGRVAWRRLTHLQ